MGLHLFEAYGVELEYMVVDRATLKVRPIVDQLLKDAAAKPGAVIEAEGDYPNQVELGPIAWSNELVLHVLEFKTALPAADLSAQPALFQEHVREANRLLAPHDAMLMPTGMHPTMDPDSEMKLWPHDYGVVYATFNKIFDCRGHGWANLQSAHFNLPFQGADTPDSEFGRLHAAIRALLPIMPALTASTPFKDGAATGLMDTRLEVYRKNSARVPAAAGKVIPEPVFTAADYDREILQAIYKAYEPCDPDGVLRYEWANSRGCIARFMRDAIEIRVLDVQECPIMDNALGAAIAAATRGICDGTVGDLGAIQRLQVDPLHEILLAVIRDADRAVIRDRDLLAALGVKSSSLTAMELWTDLIERSLKKQPDWPVWEPALRVSMEHGCLARRIQHATGASPSRDAIHTVYRELAGCLEAGRPFIG